ncbi:MAG: hypothetical protein R3C25_14885 [Hyphomonadaceae bacterium]
MDDDPKRQADQRLLQAEGDRGGDRRVQDRECPRHAREQQWARERSAKRNTIAFGFLDHG